MRKLVRYQYPLSRTGASIVSFILLHFCLRLEFREVQKNKQHVTLRGQPLKCERIKEAACMHRPKNTLSKFLLVYLLRLLVVVVVFLLILVKKAWKRNGMTRLGSPGVSSRSVSGFFDQNRQKSPGPEKHPKWLLLQKEFNSGIRGAIYWFF